jgi:ribose transport system ATP-binding protein
MSRSRVVSLMIGREERIAKIAEGPAVAGDVVLELRGVATSYGHKGIDLALRQGEILGLYGLVGAGRTELARAIVGAARITGGEVVVHGRRATIGDPHAALTRYRIGYVSEDRKGEGLILSHGVGANIAMTVWRKIASAFRLVNPAAEEKAANPYVRKLAINITSPDQIVSTLSGGNQQKVSIAKWLAAATDILIIDEPTVGIDIKTKVELYELIGDLARQGVAVLLISSDMAEMIALANRILVVHGFAIAGELINNHDYQTVSAAIMTAIHAAQSRSPPVSSCEPPTLA